MLDEEVKVALLICALAAFVLCLWAGFVDRPAVMSAGIVLVFGLLFFASVDKFERFKAGAQGIEAETRKVVDQAKAVTDELRELAASLVENQITMLARYNRPGSFGEMEKEERKNELIATLRSIGVEDESIEDSVKLWERYVIRDYAHGIIGEGNTPVELGDSVVEAYKEFRHRDFESQATPEELESFLSEHGLLTDEKKEQLEDYRYYLKKRKHRRPKAWGGASVVDAGAKQVAANPNTWQCGGALMLSVVEGDAGGTGCAVRPLCVFHFRDEPQRYRMGTRADLPVVARLPGPSRNVTHQSLGLLPDPASDGEALPPRTSATLDHLRPGTVVMIPSLFLRTGYPKPQRTRAGRAARAGGTEEASSPFFLTNFRVWVVNSVCG